MFLEEEMKKPFVKCQFFDLDYDFSLVDKHNRLNFVTDESMATSKFCHKEIQRLGRMIYWGRREHLKDLHLSDQQDVYDMLIRKLKKTEQELSKQIEDMQRECENEIQDITFIKEISKLQFPDKVVKVFH